MKLIKVDLVDVCNCSLSLINSFYQRIQKHSLPGELFIDPCLKLVDGLILNPNCVMVFLHEAKCSFFKPKVAFYLCLYL